VYESSTETLFVGRQDAMQRCTLVPLRDFMAGRDASQLQALEVAAGTGRFATYVKDNYPSLNLTVSDLSPFYLAEARNNIKVGGWAGRRVGGRVGGW
jgi:ubiquinone/menaquinone biosynthesis C-methylase UbiE